VRRNPAQKHYACIKCKEKRVRSTERTDRRGGKLGIEKWGTGQEEEVGHHHVEGIKVASCPNPN